MPTIHFRMGGWEGVLRSENDYLDTIKIMNSKAFTSYYLHNYVIMMDYNDINDWNFYVLPGAIGVFLRSLLVSKLFLDKSNQAKAKNPEEGLGHVSTIQNQIGSVFSNGVVFYDKILNLEPIKVYF